MPSVRKRPRGSLRNPIRVGFMIEQENKTALRAMARAAGTTEAAMVDALIEHARTELDDTGKPSWLPGPEELPIDAP
jgi:hypothetical protein